MDSRKAFVANWAMTVSATTFVLGLFQEAAPNVFGNMSQWTAFVVSALSFTVGWFMSPPKKEYVDVYLCSGKCAFHRVCRRYWALLGVIKKSNTAAILLTSILLLLLIELTLMK